MKVSYSIQKIQKDVGFSLKVTVKSSQGPLAASDRGALELQDKKIVDLIIKDFNANKTLKQSSLEYGKLLNIDISDKALSTLLIELAKVKEVLFEDKKIVIDALSKARLLFDAEDDTQQLFFEPFIIDGLTQYSLLEAQVFFGQSAVWILHKSVLKQLKNDFKWLKMALCEKSLTGKRRAQFLDHYDNNLPILQTTPDLRLMSKQAQSVTLEPRVYLKNDRGLFFDLCFDYGSKGVFAFHDPLNQQACTQDEQFWLDVLLMHGVKKSGRDLYVSAPDQETIFQKLITEGIPIYSQSGKKIKLLKSAQAELESDDILARITLDLDFEGTKAPLEALKEACLKKNPLVKLDDSQLGLINLKMLSDLEIVFKGHVSGNAVITKAAYKGDFLLPSLGVQTKDELKLDSLNFTSFSLSLLEFQKTGVAWLLSQLLKQKFCLLADDMGLGKTIQTLACIDLMHKQLAHGLIIVCPKSLKQQWALAFDTYLKGLDLDFKILSFHEVRALDKALECSLCVIDEAQNIKNAKTQIFQKINSIQANYKIALTGTPIENSLNDLVSIFSYLNPDVTCEFSGLSSALNYQKIKRRLSPFILRRSKQQVLKDLPELFEQECLVDMDEAQAEAYAKLLDEAKQGKHHALSLITKLRLAALDTRLIDNDSNLPSSKTWQIVEDIETIQASCQKVILFSQFTSYLTLIKEALKEKNIPFAYLDGHTQNRDKPLKEFKNDKNVLLMSLKAGGVGLNLQEADYVLIADPWWNEAAEKQAIDRAYRLGRDKPVVARRYITSGTLETKLQELKAYKWSLLEEMDNSSKVEINEVFNIIIG